MKKISLIIVTLLFFLLISCAGTQKKKDAENKEQTPKEAVEKQIDDSVKQAEELAEVEKILNEKDNSTDDKDEAEELTSAEISDELKSAIDNAVEKAVERALEKMLEKELDAKTAQADSDTEQPQETIVVTPPAQTQPPVQPQPQMPPVQPPVEEITAVSESDPSDSDSEPKREPSSSIAGVVSPAPRIESVIQMGTMPHDNEIVFSRIVRATVGQIVEIPFRGNGWVYLGEIKLQRGIVYSSRRNDSDGQSFIFTLEEAGTYILKFYRQDFIRDYIINDHVQVIADSAPAAGVGWFNPPVDRGRVVAQPRWPSAVEEAQIRNGTRPASEPVVTSGTAGESAKETASAQGTAPQQRTAPVRETNTQDRTPSQNSAVTPSSPPAAPSGQNALPAPATSAGQTTLPNQTTAAGQSVSEESSGEKREKLAPEVLLQQARENFDGGKTPTAIALLDQFMEDYPGGSDEVYWLLGQCYEANTPDRNILLSLDYYRRLVNEYPQSRRFNDTRRRIAYLERYYINIQ